jgi:Zn-dependent peptidase ImmA (M78 family)
MTTVASTTGILWPHHNHDGVDERMALLGLRRPPAIPVDDLVSGAMGRLRAVVPRRALGLREAEVVAERQANRLRSELRVLGPILSEADLATLPWLTITRREGFPTSGMATKTEYGWIIVLRSDEAIVRQRFSLAHEIKHVLDDGLLANASDLYPATRGYSADERAERVCDRFAAALLMPKVLLRADWADGLQDIVRLARRYHVSRAAMTVRLSQLGLLEATPRCSGPASPHPTTTGAPA